MEESWRQFLQKMIFRIVGLRLHRIDPAEVPEEVPEEVPAKVPAEAVDLAPQEEMNLS